MRLSLSKISGRIEKFTLLINAMDDLIKSMKAQLYDRVSSPLLSSFLIAWTAWNNRFFIVITSSELKLKERFEFVDNVLFPTWKEVLGHGFAWPLISALALLFVYPIPGRLVYEYVRKEQKRLKEIQQRIEDEMPVTQEEAKGLKALIRKADADMQKTTDEHKEVVTKLRAEIKALEEDSRRFAFKENKVTGTENAQLIKLTDYQTILLRAITEAANGLDPSKAISIEGRDPVVGQYHLDELQKHKLISLTPNGVGGLSYKATPVGRAHLVESYGTSKS